MRRRNRPITKAASWKSERRIRNFELAKLRNSQFACPEWQRHIGNKTQRRELANRFKDSKDPFKIVIVRDMWLTGFDALCLHTMYADKPMQGRGKCRMTNSEFRTN